MATLPIKVSLQILWFCQYLQKLLISPRYFRGNSLVIWTSITMTEGVLSCVPSGLGVVLHHLQRVWLEGEAALCGQPARALQLHQTRADRHPPLCSGVRCTSKQQHSSNEITDKSLWMVSEGACDRPEVWHLQLPPCLSTHVGLSVAGGWSWSFQTTSKLSVDLNSWCVVNSWYSPVMRVQLWHR